MDEFVFLFFKKGRRKEGYARRRGRGEDTGESRYRRATLVSKRRKGFHKGKTYPATTVSSLGELWVLIPHPTLDGVIVEDDSAVEQGRHCDISARKMIMKKELGMIPRVGVRVDFFDDIGRLWW